MSFPFESLTEQILAAAFQVTNELGPGFLESVYEGALFIALQERGFRAERQVPIRVHFHGHLVGNYCADILVEDQIILELKAVRALAPEHIAQTLNYLKATGMPVALLINFGAVKLEWRRFDNRFKDREEKSLNRDAGDAGDGMQKAYKEVQP